MFDIFKLLKGRVIENCSASLDGAVAAYVEAGQNAGKIEIRGTIKELESAYNRILAGKCSDADIKKVRTLFHETEHLISAQNKIWQDYNMFGGKNGATTISEICNEILARERMKQAFRGLPLFLDEGNGAYVRQVYDFQRICQRLNIDYAKLIADLPSLTKHNAEQLSALMAKHSKFDKTFCEDVIKNWYACGEDFDARFGTPLKGRDYVEKLFRQKKIIKRGENVLLKPQPWFYEWAKYGGDGYSPFETWAKNNPEVISKFIKAHSKPQVAPNISKYDRTHLARLNAYQKQVDAIYAEAIKEATRLAAQLGEISPSAAFSFADYPNTRKRIETLLEGLKSGLSGVLVNGIQSEWTLANNKNNELSRQVFGDNVGRLTQEQYRRYFSTNGVARDAFIARRDAGMNLSDRVWNYTSQFKAEMEMVCELGIRNEMTAEEMQRDLQQYLKHPDNFFRRFRYKEGTDDNGKPIYGRKWKKREWDEINQRYTWRDVDLADYSYGRGVYRSSYKNARRLAVTETNIAYRTADHLRWQQMDFVVGIRVECSKTNHPVPDICDELAGDYPKDFKWTGWHPHCRCHATPILKTEEELMEDNRRILQGDEPVESSVNAVDETPTAFNTFVKDNADKITAARTRGKEPYFLADNTLLVDKIISPPKVTRTDRSSATESAKWFSSGRQADNALRKQAGEFWRSLNSDEKQLLAEYTGDGYAEINRAMRGLEVSDPTAEDKAEDLRWLLNTSRMDKSIWVQRVETIDGLERFGIANPMSASLADLKALVGKTFDNESFASACVVKGAAENLDVDFGILFDIKVPKGTSAVYVEPFSTYGNGDGVNWDGFSKQKTIGSEAELLINAGQKFKVKSVKRKEGIWHIALEVIAS